MATDRLLLSARAASTGHGVSTSWRSTRASAACLHLLLACSGSSEDTGRGWAMERPHTAQQRSGGRDSPLQTSQVIAARLSATDAAHGG